MVLFNGFLVFLNFGIVNGHHHFIINFSVPYFFTIPSGTTILSPYEITTSARALTKFNHAPFSFGDSFKNPSKIFSVSFVGFISITLLSLNFMMKSIPSNEGEIEWPYTRIVSSEALFSLLPFMATKPDWTFFLCPIFPLSVFRLSVSF